MKVLLFANTDWYLYNFRLPLAKAIRARGIEVVLISPPGEYGARLRAEGFHWIPLPMNRRSLNPWSEMKLILALISIYRRERPDLVHHFTIKSVVYGSIAARIAGIKYRINAVTGLGHVFISKSFRARLLRPMVRFLMRFALRARHGRLILQNGDDRTLFLQNRLIEPEYIRIIRGSGVNTFRFKQTSRGAWPGGPLKVLLATRLLWEKGVGEYAEAAQILKQETENVEFLLAGSPDEGNPASVPSNCISKWAADGVLMPLGHIDDMLTLLGEVDLVVLPSYREGTPRILLEAAACGLPIVATDVPGCREVVVSGVNGLLVPAKDSDALAKAIKFMLDNPDERERMGRSGRIKVMDEFDEVNIIASTLKVYGELLPIPDARAD